ncbi:related to ALG11-required for asparagine-linked glycosylation [Sporisorium scitamineum]|uniref:GDP-Man:Man(3)GlcNAc(2)-PP-Dol alpha-1,2-mannosyltransferase n=2 Tax=Sporisorium scitamineum TaxID=49012 RepID=A0A127ZI52_9BASI|nr:related to ALG11-required for asparagine-linked glycosylation [Sporisorium scitamineum]
MDRLLTLQPALSLGYLSSLHLLPTTTSAPEWLVGSGELGTKGGWVLLWVYLVVMDLVWVVVPVVLMVDSCAGLKRWMGEVKEPRSGTTTGRLTSTRALPGSAYMLLVAAIFIYIMPTASASTPPPYDPSGTTTLFPTTTTFHRGTILTSLKSLLLPLLLPLGLVTFSFTVGAIQVADKALRKLRKTNRTRRRKLLATLSIDEKQSPRTVIGFFHPYCNAGGGGERVLYEAIAYHLSLDPQCVVIVYTGDYPSTSKEDILAKASARFGIAIDADRVAFVGLTRRWMVEDSTWRSWTLLGQSYGSVWLGFEALSRLIPDVLIDTMGYAFTYPVARLFNLHLSIAAYVHYPIISTDMLARVSARQPGHTNNARTANSLLRSRGKLIYYRVFAKVYSWALRRADVVVGNGSWTRGHLEELMGRGVEKVYPPCDTVKLAGFGLERGRGRVVVSLAQFRPEKEHPLQLRVVRRLLDIRPDLFEGEEKVKLIMMGSCRNSDDEARIDLLRALATSLGLDPYVDFVVNADYGTICAHLAQASVGVSTMKDEHFGINVVEFMAAGLVTLSHKSAGPWLDIAVPSANHLAPTTGESEQEKERGIAVGYHAETVEEFADVLAGIFDLQTSEPEKVTEMRGAARARAQSVFGREAFTEAWQRELWGKLEVKLQCKSTTKVQQQEKKEQ